MTQLRAEVQEIAAIRPDPSPVGALHPAIQGMLATLPHKGDPSDPQKWSYKKLHAWAKTFSSVLEVVYEDTDTPEPANG